MATTDAKPGFRLPWSPDRSDTGNAADAPAGEVPSGEPEALDAADRDSPTPDQEIETPAMIDTAPAATDTEAAGEDPTIALVPDLTELAAAPTPVRKQNRFMADLTKAMQVAAESERTDALARFTADAKAHIETIHATTTTEATDLRKQADDDVAAIREWSKAEIARIREETDERIVHRKSRLEREIEAHVAGIEGRVARVQARVDAFEAQMATFFERLLAEEDPTRFASMAESLPEPPAFDNDEAFDDVELIGDTADLPAERAVVLEPWPDAVATEAPAETTETTDAPETEAEAEAEAIVEDAPSTEDAVEGDLFSIGVDAPADDTDPRLAVLGLAPDFAAAEAEAAAFSADETPAEEEIAVIADEALAARLAGLVPEADGATENVSTKLVVTGLVSVASIAGFKRQLSRVAGVQSVGVSSGPDGEFLFAVAHGGEVVLRDAITTLPGFGARVTAEAEGELTVTAKDPEAEG